MVALVVAAEDACGLPVAEVFPSSGGDRVAEGLSVAEIVEPRGEGLDPHVVPRHRPDQIPEGVELTRVQGLGVADVVLEGAEHAHLLHVATVAARDLRHAVVEEQEEILLLDLAGVEDLADRRRLRRDDVALVPTLAPGAALRRGVEGEASVSRAGGGTNGLIGQLRLLDGAECVVAPHPGWERSQNSATFLWHRQ